MKTRLRDYGVKEEELDDYVGYVMGRANVKNSPGEFTDESMKDLLREAF